MTISASTGKKLSKREEWARTTGKPKEEYKSSSGNSQLKALQGQYKKSLSPTKAETEAQTQLGNIITSKELGIQKVEQEPMAQEFVTGQTAGLEKSAALKALPLQTRLANLQARRQSAADVLKAQLGFETANIDRQAQLSETASNRAFDERKFSEGVRQFNISEARLGKDTEKEGQIDAIVRQLRGQGWSDEEIKAYLLTQ